jgi:DNA-binding MarR family transcriptional regulator
MEIKKFIILAAICNHAATCNRELGCSLRQIAKVAGTRRFTTYWWLDRLEAEGLITRTANKANTIKPTDEAWAYNLRLVRRRPTLIVPYDRVEIEKPEDIKRAGAYILPNGASFILDAYRFEDTIRFRIIYGDKFNSFAKLSDVHQFVKEEIYEALHRT